MKKILDRLNRIEGQLRGLQKALSEENADCEKTIIQFKATKSAFESCFSELLTENLQKCLTTENSKDLNKILKLIIHNK